MIASEPMSLENCQQITQLKNILARYAELKQLRAAVKIAEQEVAAWKLDHPNYAGAKTHRETRTRH